jgi:hypothetical protein
MSTYFFMFELRPKPDGKHFGKLAGAMASLCIVDLSEPSARKRAVDYLTSEHWNIIKDERSCIVDRASCSNTVELSTLYNLAQQDGISCIVAAGVFGDESLN